MANTDTNIWMWILLLSVVFYLYVDSRLNRIRTELLEHYTRIESMLTQNVLSGAQRIKEHFEDITGFLRNKKMENLREIERTVAR